MDDEKDIRYLPEDYEASPNDVLCGRGRKCYFHPGNVRFRDIVQCHLAKYSAATSKMEKGNIISVVYGEICEQADLGGFIKKDDNGRWYDVGEFLAREKVSQAFRDALHDKYKSSTTSKRKRRELMAMSSELNSQRSLCSYTSASTEPSFDDLERTVFPTTLQPQGQELVSNQLLDLLDRDLETVFSSSQGVPQGLNNSADVSFPSSDHPSGDHNNSSHVLPPRFSRFDLLHKQQSCPSMGWKATSRSTGNDLMSLAMRPPRYPTEKEDTFASAPPQQQELRVHSSHAPRFNRFDMLHKQSSCPSFAWPGNSGRSLGGSVGIVSDEDLSDDLEPLPCDVVPEIDFHAADFSAFDAFQ